MCAQPATAATTRIVSTGQVDLHVTEYGESPEPLILLHGIGSDFSSWWPVVDRLAAHFRLIVPDQRGHGRSQKPDSGYLVPDYARDLDGLIAAYGLDRPKIL
ncbi:MAG: alpha/beta fold hydrolase, partial [Planctomycetales bacterium]|nr:alpha/beta fold hydrolase [Planctomycetales bacterium]